MTLGSAPAGPRIGQTCLTHRVDHMRLYKDYIKYYQVVMTLGSAPAGPRIGQTCLTHRVDHMRLYKAHTRAELRNRQLCKFMMEEQSFCD